MKPLELQFSVAVSSISNRVIDEISLLVELDDDIHLQLDSSLRQAKFSVAERETKTGSSEFLASAAPQFKIGGSLSSEKEWHLQASRFASSQFHKVPHSLQPYAC